MLCAEERCFHPITKGEDTGAQAHNINTHTGDREGLVGPENVASCGTCICGHHFAE